MDAHVTSFNHINNKEDPIPILPGMFLGYVHPSGEVHIEDSGEWASCPGECSSSVPRRCIYGPCSVQARIIRARSVLWETCLRFGMVVNPITMARTMELRWDVRFLGRVYFWRSMVICCIFGHKKKTLTKSLAIYVHVLLVRTQTGLVEVHLLTLNWSFTDKYGQDSCRLGTSSTQYPCM